VLFFVILGAAQKVQRAQDKGETSYYYCLDEQEELESAEEAYIKVLQLALLEQASVPVDELPLDQF